jgi:hypothetical protein
MSAQAARVAGIAGIVAFGLIAITGVFVAPMWDTPDTASTASEIAAYYDEHRSSTLTAIFLYGLAMTLFLVFAVGVWRRLQDAEGLGGFVSTVFAFAVVAMTALIFAGFVPVWVLAYRAPDLAAARSLHDLSFGVLAMSGFPTALALVAYAALVERARLSIWTAWLAWIAAVAHVVIAGSVFAEEGFFALEGDGIVWIPGTLFVWMLVTSIALLRPEGLAAEPGDAGDEALIGRRGATDGRDGAD